MTQPLFFDVLSYFAIFAMGIVCIMLLAMCASVILSVYQQWKGYK